MAAVRFEDVDPDAEAERGCRRKEPLHRNDAMALADKLRSRGVDVTAYRCCFSEGGRHWHVGRPPSLRGLERIAAAMRNKHNEEK